MVDQRDILLSDDVISEPDRVRAVLSRRVDDLLRESRKGPADRHVVRLVVRLAPSDAHAWLAAQDLLPKIYWHGRRDEPVTASVGAADRVYGGAGAGYDSLRAQLDAVLPKSDARVRYFGGFRFDFTAEADAAWKPFGTYRFVLPRFAYTCRRDRSVLACNLLLPRDAEHRETILEEIRQLRFPEGGLDDPLPLPISRTDEPDRDAWTRNVERSLDAFGRSELEKIVLARRVVYGFAEPLNSIALLKKLEEATENCFHFAFQFDAAGGFVGATPERLFRRSGRRIWTEAVAGTRPRGATPEADERAVASLLASEKDQREHAYVRDSIRTALDPLCDDFRIDSDASGLRLARGWHLVSRSEGVLKSGVHGSDVMRALHPTPAVGGYPTEAAVDAIRRFECFDRGWYAGPVGWIGSHGAEFAVALRCGLVRGTTLSLFSGAGIVDGSEPSAEWEEIEQKIGDFLKVFDLQSR